MFTKSLLPYPLLLLFLLVIACSPQPSVKNQYAVIPLPQSLSAQDGQFVLTQDLVITAAENPAVQKVLDGFAAYLQQETGLSISTSAEKGGAAVLFEIQETVEHPEGYALTITPEQVRVSAQTPQGLFYATQTLKQLLQKDPNLGWYLPAVQISDAPRFSYRGMHLDVVRHFHPVETVKAMLDQLAYHKLNTFHWHLTDDQGWRIEIK
ncbi:MAG: family 20 glycosylhydrolase, partial [Phaeodactylibacter sp.]|nr:family 20 glycosylhydrolase [Phaeodactylibacter sp.]